MIEKNVAALAIEAGQSLNQSGVVLSPVNGTPLATLTRMSSITMVSAEEQEATQLVNAADNDIHNQAMEEAVTMVVNATQGHMDFARNTASPVVEEFLQKLADQVGDLGVNAYFDFKINEVGVPEILEATDFMEVIERYNTGTTLVPSFSMRYPEYPNEKLITETLKTGSPAVDKLIEDWTLGLPEGFLQTVWQSVFQDKEQAMATAPVVPNEDLFKDSSTGIHAALLVFLLCQRLMEEVTSDAGMALSELREKLSQLRSSAASYVVIQKHNIESFKATSTIVRGFQKKTVEVDKASYEDYLAGGGRVEVLLGALIAKRNWQTSAELTAHAEEAMQIWQSYQFANQSRADSEMVGRIKQTAINLFEQDLESPRPAETDMLMNQGVKTGMVKAFGEAIEQLSTGDVLNNHSDLIWRIVCKTRFGYTGAYAILSNIDYYVKKHGMSMEDAASQAMYAYVQMYVNSMIEVTAISSTR